jgi:hypothetical protein
MTERSAPLPHNGHVVERAAKPRLQRLLQYAERERYAAHRQMENHLYKCLYDVIRSDLQPAKKLAAINRYKAKLVHHSTNKPHRSLLDRTQKDFLEGETPTIYQIIRTNQRRAARRITQITDGTGAPIQHTTI